MILLENAVTKEGEKGYVLEYSIVQSRNEDETNEVTEYGIRCDLYQAENVLDWEMVNGITSEKHRAEKFLQILERNQVFPAHLRDVIEDLLIMEYEEKI